MTQLAISNLAWHQHEEKTVARLLPEYSFTGVEIAPTKVWQHPLEVTPLMIEQYREFWEQHGIRIVALQSVLFGCPDMLIFGSKLQRQNTLHHLFRMIDLASLLKAPVIVFGSPRNRARLEYCNEAATKIALPFFRRLGDYAANMSVIFCIEPNPIVYGCDFVQTAEEGEKLVRMVDSPGFALHLDSAGMVLSNDDISFAILHSIPVLKHFHVSEPQLQPVGGGVVDHRLFARALSNACYRHWISIEMKANDDEMNIEQIRSSLNFVASIYSQPVEAE